jgi:hypothetical protein
MPDSQTKWEGWGAFGKDSVKGNLFVSNRSIRVATPWNVR